MSQPKMKHPGPDHPIAIAAANSHVGVSVAGKTIAETDNALLLKEASYPGVLYVPREDVDMLALEKTGHATHCPYKGECSYYSIPAGGERSVNAIWSYEDPYEAVGAIKGYMAFYPDRVDGITVTPAP